MINVTCAIIKNKSIFLVTQRSGKMKLPYKWEFPGGKIEKGESEEICIKREILEELNIDIEVVGRLSNSIYDYGDFKICLIPFIAEYVFGVIKLTEHNDYKWVEKLDLLKLDWAPADLPIVNELLTI